MARRPPGGGSSISLVDVEPPKPTDNRRPTGGSSPSLFGSDDNLTKPQVFMPQQPPGGRSSLFSEPEPIKKQIDPKRFESSITLTPENDIKPQNKILPQAVSHISFTDDAPSQPQLSTRVNAPGGTGGQSRVGLGEEEPLKTSRRMNPQANQNISHFDLSVDTQTITSTKVNAPGGTGGKSSIAFSDEQPLTPSRRHLQNPNESHFKLSDEPVAIEPPKHQTSKSPNEQTFDLADQSPAPIKTSLKVTHEPGGGAHLKRLGDDETKYETMSQSGLGEEAKKKFEPKRVTQPPGGASSIFF